MSNTICPKCKRLVNSKTHICKAQREERSNDANAMGANPTQQQIDAAAALLATTATIEQPVVVESAPNTSCIDDAPSSDSGSSDSGSSDSGSIGCE